jgi:nitrite reductase (NADH) large subunit
MAEAVAGQLAGEEAQFQGADMSTKLKLLGMDVGSIGDDHGRAEGSMSFVFSDEREEYYKRIVTSADGKQLLGAVLVGDCDNYDTLLQYYLNDIELPADPQCLIVPAAGEQRRRFVPVITSPRAMLSPRLTVVVARWAR